MWTGAVAGFLAVAAVGAGVYAFREAIFPLPPIGELRETTLALLRSIPIPVYFVAFVVLPAAGAPLTFFYLTALPVMGQESTVLGLAAAFAALALNMVICYLLARGFFHPLIEWVIRHRHLRVPKIKPENELQLVLAARLSPAPFALQNYLLALGHARWKFYLFLSFPIQAGIGLAMMLFGESVFEGGLAYALFGAFLLVLALLILRLVRQRFRKRLDELHD